MATASQFYFFDCLRCRLSKASNSFETLRALESLRSLVTLETHGLKQTKATDIGSLCLFND